MARKIYLIPTAIGEHDIPSPQNVAVVESLRFFFVEDVRTARRWISSLKAGINIDDLHFEILDKDTKDAKEIFEKVPASENIGIMSEAGSPGIADPGAIAVAYAHRKGYEVIPLAGSSSVSLALAASGLNGQSFAFLGYLPVKPEDRKVKIQELSKIIKETGQAQIFIETPYRNDSLLKDLVKVLPDDLMLCIAKGILTAEQRISTKKIKSWRGNMPVLGKVPTVFILGKEE